MFCRMHPNPILTKSYELNLDPVSTQRRDLVPDLGSDTRSGAPMSIHGSRNPKIHLLSLQVGP